MYYDGVYFHTIIFNFTFECSLTSEIYHSPIPLNRPVIGGYEISYEVIDMFVHKCVVMIVNYNE